VYLSLFISAFAAATILPAQSEALLAYQVSISPDAVVQLVAVATLGNVLGATFNLVAGILREPLLSFVLLVTIAKCARYVFVVGLAAFLL